MYYPLYLSHRETRRRSYSIHCITATIANATLPFYTVITVIMITKNGQTHFCENATKNPLGREPISVKLLPSYNCIHISPNNIECTAHNADNKSSGISVDKTAVATSYFP